MAQPIIPINTLKDLIESKGINVLDSNIIGFDIDSSNLDRVQLNYPSRTMGNGIILITKGTASLKIDFQSMEVGEKDVITVFPNNVLEFKSFSPDCCIKGVLVSVDYLSQIDIQLNSHEAMDYLSKNYSKIISLTKDNGRIIDFHIQRIQALNNPNEDNFFYLDMLKRHMTLIVYELANFSKFQNNNHDFISFRKENIAVEFLNLVNQNFREHKDVQYYADRIYISRKHLTRTIKEVFHKAPKQIIEDKITVEAKMLLLKSEANISLVMEELHFEDQAVFSKFFKKNTGLTPTAYRRETLKKS
tara:strand:- start:698 stop:1606 length:909 start_codon:yes stop_codon:yes gene_type:complete